MVMPARRGQSERLSFRGYVLLSFTRQHSQSPPNQSCTSGEGDSSLSIHVSLCRQDCLPAHTAMITPARRGLRSLYHVFVAHRAAMAAVNERPGFGRALPFRLCRAFIIPYFFISFLLFCRKFKAQKLSFPKYSVCAGIPPVQLRRLSLRRRSCKDKKREAACASPFIK